MHCILFFAPFQIYPLFCLFELFEGANIKPLTRECLSPDFLMFHDVGDEFPSLEFPSIFFLSFFEEKGYVFEMLFFDGIDHCRTEGRRRSFRLFYKSGDVIFFIECDISELFREF